MDGLKKERKFLYILSLNGGEGTYLTTFTTSSKGRGSLLFERIVNISLCVAPNGFSLQGLNPAFPLPFRERARVRGI
jgi:hypothetical protein